MAAETHVMAMDQGAGVMPTPASLAPVSTSERSHVMDALRGFAVLGILAMNIGGFAFRGADFFNPTIGGFEGADRAVWLYCRFIFDMKMQSLFSMLFGAGVVVLGARATATGRSLTPLFLRRIGLLAVFGILHAYLLWFGDILWTYALCGLAIYPLRKLPTGWILGLGIGLFLFGAATTAVTGYGFEFVKDTAHEAQAALDSGGTPTELQQGMLEAWRDLSEGFIPDAEAIAAEEAAHRGGYLDVVKHRAPEALTFQIGPPFWIMSLWRFSGYMLIGLAMMRLGVFTGKLSSRAYGVMSLIGYGVGLPVTWFGVQQAISEQFDFIRTFQTCWHWNYLASLPVAFGHVGACMLIFRSPWVRELTNVLAAAGRMALTNYLMQSLICAVIFFGWGFDQWMRLSRTEVAAVVLAIWALQLSWSSWWLSYFRFGPAEWLWRSLTYLRPQPWR